ncbi:MAG TPA: type I glyceraldehyde-3-phosphate dehydrogenase [Marinobacter hydrocarbonoclasticus]|nr:type I glyceraldehyde-3-phosphate dehydrogenase [Marinobacter nauticus]
MSKIKVGINGFGRIGRLALRAAWGWPDMEFVAINDPGADAATLAHLLNFDSIHGRWSHEATADGTEIEIEGKRIRVTHNRTIGETDWSGCDLVIEASGVNKKVSALQAYLDQGVKRVVVTAPVKEAGAKNIVVGVNDDIFEPANDRIVTAASCTTNCLAPVVEALHKTVGIESGLMTTIHSYTNDQKLSDVYHTDLYRARSATQSMIPTKTGAAAAIGKVIPDLNGKLDGLAVRVPTINVSLVDFGFIAGRDTTVEEINEAVKAAAENNPVLGYNVEKLVSVDFNHNALSSVFDANHTRVIGRHVKVMAWYDNEWGFSNRMLDNAIALMNASK